MIKLTTRPGVVIPASRRTAIIARLNGDVFTPATKQRLKKYTTSRAVRSLGMALVVPVAAPASIVVPTAETKDIDDFFYPVVDDTGMVTGYAEQDVTVLVWLTTQNGLRWDFMYRPAGTVVPIKPPIVSEDARQGMAAIVLPRGEYEYLPDFR